jgi:hypothetical protein
MKNLYISDQTIGYIEMNQNLLRIAFAFVLAFGGSLFVFSSDQIAVA